MTSPKSSAKSQARPKAVPDQVPPTAPQLVVAHLKDRLVKGHLLQPKWPFGNGHSNGAAPDVLQIQLLSSGLTEDVRLTDAKAVFLVRDLQGNFRRTSVLFHHERAPQKTLWVRVIFKDGEELEGMLDNTTELITGPCLRLIPTDPNSNNLEMYVPKSSIREFCVLGMRN